MQSSQIVREVRATNLLSTGLNGHVAGLIVLLDLRTVLLNALLAILRECRISSLTYVGD